MRLKRSRRREPFDLRDHNSAVVAHGERLVERAENATFMFVGKVSALVGGRCADDGDFWRDARKEEPLIPGKANALDDRIGCRPRVHRATVVDRIDERVHAHLRQHARALGCRLAMHVEQYARRDVIGRDGVACDHLPDLGRFGRGGARRIGSRKNAREAPRLGEVIDALDAPHVSSGDWVQGGDIARMALGLEACADRRERRIRTSERGRR